MSDDTPTILRSVKRAWCADECGTRVLLSKHVVDRGGVCDSCYWKAMECMAREEEERQLRGYTDEERARI